VKEKLGLVNFKNIEMDQEGKVFLKKKGMAIDLGGIAKGYAKTVSRLVLDGYRLMKKGVQR